jgi:formate/nitrite transporter FocA (FNT family)
MSIAPTPAEIFERASEEGERRLDQSLLELVSNGFIAGVTIVFGVVALGIVHGALGPASGGAAKIGGALAFGLGVVFLVVGRSELFSENFFDAVATVVDRKRPVARLFRLWGLTYLLNLLGAAVLALVLSVEGALPAGTADALAKVAEEIVAPGPWAMFVGAIAGGALVALLSFLLQAVNGVGGRIAMAYMAGFVLALGPLDHVIVTALHIFFGILFGGDVGFSELGGALVIVTAGNLVGGLGLVTLTHVGQAKGESRSGG